MPPPLLLEVCVDSAEGAIAAEIGGADRVELCAGLVEGGTTPSLGTIETTLAHVEIPVLVMLRPRGGDFLASERELETLRRDLAAVRNLGARGVVFGLLDADGRIDSEHTRELVELARPLEVTFHRAFDLSRDPFESLDLLLEIGVDRLLTSGQAPSALEGAATIAELVRHAGDRLRIVAGGGVREHNVREVVERTGVSEVHSSASVVLESAMQHRNPHCRMGATQVPGEYERKTTDSERVLAIARALRSGDSPGDRPRADGRQRVI